MKRLCLIVLAATATVLAAADPVKETPPAVTGNNLLPNGDFEKGSGTPEGWQKVDGLTSFWLQDSDPTRGKVLKLDTDVLQSQGYEWWARIRAGTVTAAEAPAKLPTVEPKYDTLAGLDGVWFWSDAVPIKKGKAYWVTMDVKGPELLAWLVGYTNSPDLSFGADAAAFIGYVRTQAGERLDVRDHKTMIHAYDWKGQMKAGGAADQWKTYSRRAKPFKPTEIFPDIKYVRIMIYPYWPPAAFYVDNVRLMEVDE